jgi:hypothetical protein
MRILEISQWWAEFYFAGTAILGDEYLPLIPRQSKHKSLLI